jgi:hypothetical protein
MLFLGFGVRHFSLRILLHVLNSGALTSRSIALEQFEESRDNRSVRRTKLFVQQGHMIDFIDMDLGDFTRELRQRYLERYGDPKTSQASTPQVGGGALEPPHVFLSYCHEDKPQAERIKAELERRGIKVWYDSESLRAGQDWDDAIERVLRDEIDGFIILNSPMLVSKTFGYVNKEIKLALRCAEMARGMGFVYPVLIDGADPLPGLDRLQSVNGEREDHLDKLARDIKRDYQQRKKTLK